jgi:hypothetical protein
MNPTPGRRPLLLLAFGLALGPAWGGSALAQGRMDMFRDPQDGAFDMSAWLATAGGFLPVVTPVTEPAVGYGGALALAFLHRPKGWGIEEARRQFEARERMAIPSASVGFGMYTSNGSWAAGGGHIGIWGGGRWRYVGTLMVLGLELSQQRTRPSGRPIFIDYSLNGWGILQSLQYRVGDSDLYVGGSYSLFSNTTAVTFQGLPTLPEEESALAGAGLGLMYDSRNSPFTPDRGVLAEVKGTRHDSALGGDYDYWSGAGKIRGWWDPAGSLVLGLRAEASAASEGVPFWARPSVSLRGIARGRYTGDRAGTLESEVRWDFSRRWSVVGFGGAGWNVDRDGDTSRWVGGGGLGFRYLLARAFGMRGGVDLAWGEDGFAVYLTTGSAW